MHQVLSPQLLEENIDYQQHCQSQVAQPYLLQRQLSPWKHEYLGPTPGSHPQGGPVQVVMACGVELCPHSIQSSLNLHLTQEPLMWPYELLRSSTTTAIGVSLHKGQNHSFTFGVVLLCPYQGSLASYESLIHFLAHELHSLRDTFKMTEE